MHRMRADSRLFVFEILILFVICISIMTRQNDLTSLLFRMTFIVLFLGFSIQILKRPKFNSLHMLALVLAIIAFYNVSARSGMMNFNYYNKLTIFLCSVFIIPFLSTIEVNKRLVNWIIGINLCIASTYPVMYYLFGKSVYLGKLLTINFSNPNLLAMYLLHSILYCAMAMYYFKGRISRSFIFALLVILLQLNYATGARSTMISFGFFIGFIVVNFIMKKDVKVSSKLSFIILLLPLLIAIAYLSLEESGLLEKYLYFLDFGDGKAVDSRVAVWQYAIDIFKEFPITGNYYRISGGEGMSQMHNTHIDILASYGIVPFVLFIILLHKFIKKIIPIARSNFARMSLFAFYVVFFEGTFEAALVSGGVGLYIMSFGFLLLAKYNEKVDFI